jgi:hypothetical protein
MAIRYPLRIFATLGGIVVIAPNEAVLPSHHGVMRRISAKRAVAVTADTTKTETHIADLNTRRYLGDDLLVSLVFPVNIADETYRSLYLSVLPCYLSKKRYFYRLDK